MFILTSILGWGGLFVYTFIKKGSINKKNSWQHMPSDIGFLGIPSTYIQRVYLFNLKKHPDVDYIFPWCNIQVHVYKTGTVEELFISRVCIFFTGDPTLPRVLGMYSILKAIALIHCTVFIHYRP